MSCDLLPSDRPGPHYQGDVREIINDGWDLMIAHPPCQYLSYAGNVWLKVPGRLEKREEALTFFRLLADSPISKIAIENPPGHTWKAYRRPDQIIQPYQFGHPVHKKTCLWLKNLPILIGDFKATPPPPIRHDGKRNRHWVDCVGGGGESGRKRRSKTFEGIARAMAAQWGPVV